MCEYCPMRHQKNGNCLPVGGFCPNAVSEPICEAMHSAYQMGFDAGVISEQRAEKNVPLTLDDLKEMDGQPVWVQTPGIPQYGRWAIVEGVSEDGTALFLKDDFTCHEYGRVWLAYRRPPGKKEA